MLWNRIGHVNVLAAAAVLAAVALAGTSLLILGESGSRSATSPPAASPEILAPGQDISKVMPGAEGTLTGSAAYPAGSAPADLTVCAEATDRPFTACAEVTEGAGFLHGLGYRLAVPAGTYRVYSVSKATDPGYRGYYTAGARCERQLAGQSGYEASHCSDRSILTVSVTGGQTVARIDAVDYYGPFNRRFRIPASGSGSVTHPGP
ncbi:MAG: hypothetical protein WD603_03415 [Patescibacteria group bacterium]